MMIIGTNTRRGGAENPSELRATCSGYEARLKFWAAPEYVERRLKTARERGLGGEAEPLNGALWIAD